MVKQPFPTTWFHSALTAAAIGEPTVGQLCLAADATHGLSIGLSMQAQDQVKDQGSLADRFSLFNLSKIRSGGNRRSRPI